MNVNLGIKSGPQNIFSKEIMLPRFFDGALKDFRAFREFAADVDVSRARIERVA